MSSTSPRQVVLGCMGNQQGTIQRGRASKQHLSTVSASFPTQFTSVMDYCDVEALSDVNSVLPQVASDPDRVFITAAGRELQWQV